MQFPNGSGVRVNMMYPTDYSHWGVQLKVKGVVEGGSWREAEGEKVC